jgi:AraC-like DNA-binding protein
VAWEIHIDAVDLVPRPVIAIGHNYPDGHRVKPHHHRRGQLISSATGVIVVSTGEGTWVMPPHRGMWIPPATQHRVQMVGAVSVQSLYIEPEAIPGLPSHCQVVGISPFMRSLITEALGVPIEYELEGRAGALMQLIHYEMQQLPALALSLRYPAHGPLSALCRQFVQEPNIHETIDAWADVLGTSRRSFTRLFRRETGMSFVGWRQQACLLCAMPRLAAGETVTSVAIDLGYENPAAFTLMFRRAFGNPPLAYLGLRKS